MNNENPLAWKDRPYAEISDKIQKVVWPYLVDIWDHDENRLRVKISDLCFTIMELDISKDLINDKCFDTADYALNEWRRLMRPRNRVAKNGFNS